MLKILDCHSAAHILPAVWTASVTLTDAQVLMRAAEARYKACNPAGLPEKKLIGISVGMPGLQFPTGDTRKKMNEDYPSLYRMFRAIHFCFYPEANAFMDGRITKFLMKVSTFFLSDLMPGGSVRADSHNDVATAVNTVAKDERALLLISRRSLDWDPVAVIAELRAQGVPMTAIEAQDQMRRSIRTATR